MILHRSQIFGLLLISVYACRKNETSVSETRLSLYNLERKESYTLDSDSTYSLNLLPLIKNADRGNSILIGSIYGRHDREEFDFYPKFGMNIYKEGKKIEFKIYRGCGNHGYLQAKDFVTVAPGGYFLPSLDYKTGTGRYYSPQIKIKERGEMEIEFYYSMKDSSQIKYHPIFTNELKYPIAIEEYNEIRPYFLKTARLDLKSNRIKVVFL